MKTIAYLSYFINQRTPLYGGEKAIEIEKRSEISKGASSNTKYLKFPNHTGTHIDFPNHFSDKGKTINDYPALFWIFNKVAVIPVPVEQDQIIVEDDVEIKNISKDTDFLILKTNFGKYRNEKIYWNNNPGLSPELALALRKGLPKLKVIGFDFISVSGYQNRMLGREAHKAFLLENDILLIEDMKLELLKENDKIIRLIALPLFVNKIDGVPISIIAVIDS